MSDNNLKEFIFQYVPYESFVHQSFWYKLSELKLNVDKLNDESRKIFGFYTNPSTEICTMEIDCTAFNSEFQHENFMFPCYGILHNKNTIEDFKNCDKNALLQQEGNRIWNQMTNGECIQNPSLLSTFVLLSFGDLKKFNYYYWFAFPTLCEPVLKSNEEYKLEKITDQFSDSQLTFITKLYFNLRQEQKSYFILEKIDEFTFKTIYLHELMQHNDIENNFRNINLDTMYICYSDPSGYKNVGWSLRLFIVFLIHLCPLLRGKQLNFISIRIKQKTTIENSLMFSIKLPEDDININNLKWIGWEKHYNGKFIPRSVSLAESMDSHKLAENAVNLNLKLMKWRLLPDLNLDIIANTKCLLLGAGTLGCTVARNLLPWGVNTITFVDNGKVSMSNPVRQSLFRHSDTLNGGLDKATTAAERLKEISPTINATGHNIHIPMPGHPVGAYFLEKTINDIKQIETLIKEHDVIFLLTDSRESRWLPTVIGSYLNKIVISTALGFESYSVIRYGSRNINDDDKNITFEIINDTLKCIPGNYLGCYFCNDVTAPGNSMKDRTLDQQCTVTRPAVSNIAGSLAVELLISVLQHPAKELAPAYVVVNSKIQQSIRDLSIPEGILGIIPHSIRGYLTSFEHILPATQRFHQCIACSKFVLENYEKLGNEFLFKVFESTKYLEDITGISNVMSNCPEVIDFSDSELMSDSD